MTGLLVITAGLLLVSGAIKMRSGARVGLSVQPLVLLEILLGLMCGAVSAAGAGGRAAAVWIVPAGVLLVLASSVVFASRMSAVRRLRAETEGKRLERYLTYFAVLDDDDPPG